LFNREKSIQLDHPKETSIDVEPNTKCIARLGQTGIAAGRGVVRRDAVSEVAKSGAAISSDAKIKILRLGTLRIGMSDVRTPYATCFFVWREGFTKEIAQCRS
jgi:hypothetical protein